MVDNTPNETGFSPVQIKTITEIIAAALAQDRAQNQVPPTSSYEHIVDERESPEPTSGHQASADNAVPVENDLSKQFPELKDKFEAELKDKFEKLVIAKEKDPVTNFHLVEGTQFMVSMVQTSSDTEWSKKISELEDFLGIGDEASKMVQEQKAKARILQSVLAAEDAEEAERKVMEMADHGEAG
ncbi:hypothetical protein JCGZ_19506 [Jatropha curcas]|uniref:Uncharacterized protein n=1 Tax=Jatropha curcas TaxID=180498 RepID=A0A067K9N8_JATCU|nr:hypothetical protein JCGZ_19506 [Jatropha curcas]